MEAAGLPAGVRIADAIPADAALLTRLFRTFNLQQRDPADLLDVAILTRDMFGDAPWMHAFIARAARPAVPALPAQGSPSADSHWSSGEDAAGFAAWYPSYEPAYAARGAYVAALWVEPEWRRRGLAGALLARVAERIGTLGGEYLWWATKPWNAEARATYAALGAFEDTSRLHVMVGDAFRRIRERAAAGRAAPQSEETPAP